MAPMVSPHTMGVPIEGRDMTLLRTYGPEVSFTARSAARNREWPGLLVLTGTELGSTPLVADEANRSA